MKAKHTPGPWEVHEVRNRHVCISGPNHLSLADAWALEFDGYDWFIRGEMRSSKKKAADDLRSLKATLKEVDSLRKQRDDLLAALFVITKRPAIEAFSIAEAALSSVKKGETK